jgi:transcriptional regulator GlxA family with amidase domain
MIAHIFQNIGAISFCGISFQSSRAKLPGHTAVDYIRSVRLKKAAILLMRKTVTVAEVMYMVGFSNHSYFAKRFHEMYGKSPKHYAEEEPLKL